MAEKIVVMTTSEIFRSWYSKVGLPKVAEVETSDGRLAPFCTTGAIEGAMEKGYDVYVVTTRSSLGDHDDWWVELVDKDKIFLADAKFEGEFGEAWRYEDEHVDKSNSGWMKLFKHLNIEWPQDEDGPVHWSVARMYLKNQHGFMLGAEFKTKSPRQLELLSKMKKMEKANDK